MASKVHKGDAKTQACPSWLNSLAVTSLTGHLAAYNMKTYS